MIKIHVIATEIHFDLSELMIDAAEEISASLGAEIYAITWAPGSLEIPFLANEILLSSKPDALVILGMIQKGKTKHGEVVANAMTLALLDLQKLHRMPMAVAVIGPGSTKEHALQKAKFTAEKAMRVATKMVHLIKDIRKF